jgi:hypothetical protein
MNRIQKTGRPARCLSLIAIIIFFSFFLESSAIAHGPKGHTQAFTMLAAAKKATGMYDKLIASGKLDASWETGLETINVYWRDTGKKEIVVKFSRSAGEPKSVYIFFNEGGGYSGSNFSGK